MHYLQKRLSHYRKPDFDGAWDRVAYYLESLSGTFTNWDICGKRDAGVLVGFSFGMESDNVAQWCHVQASGESHGLVLTLVEKTDGVGVEPEYYREGHAVVGRVTAGPWQRTSDALNAERASVARSYAGIVG